MSQQQEPSILLSDGKKKQVLADLFAQCRARGTMIFTNEEVSETADRIGFENPYDAVNIDQISQIPDVMRKADFTLIHVGEGAYMFVRGLSTAFHEFEPIPSNCVFMRKYRHGILDELDTSKDDILSVGMNQRILPDFLPDEFAAIPNIYNTRPTKKSLDYTFNETPIQATNLQIEMDMACEYDNCVTIFKGKSVPTPDFPVHQLFHPWLYFTTLRENGEIESKGLGCCYLMHFTQGEALVVRLYMYEFGKKNPASISLKRCAEYRLARP
ncbi:MAG: hypothetical protein OXU53_06490 [Deltaproteobacteria bacterium]|nr:hypothetical protein [Deltaproteobacteria bacterium]